MKIASWNVNGLRSVLGKGLLDWLSKGNFDLVLLQEVKAKPEVIDEIGEFYKDVGFSYAAWASAKKNGYSGLLTLVSEKVFKKHKPDSGRGLEIAKFDDEGRWLEVNIGKYTVINSYFPNSQRDHARLPYKLEFCHAAKTRLREISQSGQIPIIAGDINIAHTEIDLANPKSNKNNAGFLPEERAWMTEFLDAGFLDVFRVFEKGPGYYTWWSYRPGVREKNIGWRLDHFFILKKDQSILKSMTHQPEVKGSDHCPIVLSVQNPPIL